MYIWMIILDVNYVLDILLTIHLYIQINTHHYGN